MQHRLILLVPQPDNFSHRLDEFHEHWNNAHADFVFPVPQVVGYIQNRPVDNRWHWDRFHGVAELFFENAQSEEDAWRSEPWVTGLAPDERYLLDVENGWSSVVESVESVRPGERLGFRVLAFGGDAERLPVGDGEVSLIRLQEAPPLPGASNRVLSVFAGSLAAAEQVASAVGGASLIARSTVLIDPPHP